jgi:rubrerythrin
MTNPGSQSRADPPFVGRCMACGYDLRGCNSDRCPECGLSRQLDTITIQDSVQYHRARAALEREGLLTRFMDPSGAEEIGASGLRHPGWLWVDQTKLDRVEEILDELGIPNSINSRPIVDRSEPTCPRCSGMLDSYGPEQCPHCGALFTWVNISEPEVMPANVTCMSCGYDLTGNVSATCPECGAVAAVPAERLVAMATDEPGSFHSPQACKLRWPSWASGLLAGLGIGTAVSWVSSDPDTPSALPMVLLVVVAVIVAALVTTVVERRHAARTQK